MSSRESRHALFEAIALMGKAFASPVRLELLDLMAQAPRSVEELARASGQSNANTSQHLQALRAAGMVCRARARARGFATRSRATRRCETGWRCAASAARLGEVERAARDYLGDEVETIDREALLERSARGDVVLVDMRPQVEYEAGHIDGARSIPLEELARLLTELPPDTEVVAYCRGPFCAWKLEHNTRITEEAAA